LLGAGLLWFGWFNAECTGLGGLRQWLFVANTAAAAATLTWLILEAVLRVKLLL